MFKMIRLTICYDGQMPAEYARARDGTKRKIYRLHSKTNV